VQKEHTYHRVVAAERLRRRLAAFATSPGAAQRVGTGGAEGAEGVVPVPVPVEAPSEASAFADAVAMRTGGGPGGGPGGGGGGGGAGATLLALRLLPALGSGFGGTAASVETHQSASYQPQRTFKRGVASRRKRPRAR
jgi:hypothetical protein